MKMIDLKYRLCKMYGGGFSSADYCQFLKNKGIKIGDGTYFFDPLNTLIDVQRPWMLSIGGYCKITSGVKILQHDYSRSVFRMVYGDIIAESKKTVIGNNVFIGVNSIILMGSEIGDNTIIAAGSVVHGHIPSNVVCGGNPCKIICSLEDYYIKRKQLYEEEAIDQAIEFYKRNQRWPSIKEMGAFFPLYIERNLEVLKQNNIKINLSGDDEKSICSSFLNSTSQYTSFEHFIETCKNKINEANNL